MQNENVATSSDAPLRIVTDTSQTPGMNMSIGATVKLPSVSLVTVGVLGDR